MVLECGVEILMKDPVLCLSVTMVALLNEGNISFIILVCSSGVFHGMTSYFSSSMYGGEVAKFLWLLVKPLW